MTTVDDDDRCALTELPKDGCSHCRGGRDQLAAPGHADPDELGVRFTAQYGGRCANCDGGFLPGDVIGRFRDGSGYACPDCLP
jgi:hypothetical protein